MARISKEQTYTVSLSALGSVIAAAGAVWGFAAPIAQNAVAGEIQKEIAKQIAPIQSQISKNAKAQIISLAATVKNLQTAVTALEFKMDMCRGSDCWTIRDAQDLTAARNDLRAAQDALAALRE